METDFKRLLPLLLLVTLPAVVQAQFSYASSNGTVTITRYIGGGGAVTIPGTITGLPVTSVGDSAFASCTRLTSVAIPTNVTSIGPSAFENCTSLTSVTIPGSVTNVGSEAFGLCSSLTTITVGPPNLAYSSVAGVLFNKNQTTLIAYPAGNAGAYTIPNSVTSIGDYAFYSCSSLTNVTIPDSVTNIGDYAFENCTRLTNSYFQGNAPVIGASEFSGDNDTIVYYLSATKGWGSTFADRPTALWDPVIISQPPFRLLSCPGSSCGFGVVVDGKPPLAYHWRKNGTNLADTATCFGPRTAQLMLSNLSELDTAYYDVVVTNSAGSTTSAVAALTIGYTPARATPVVVNGFVVGANLIDGGCGYPASPIITFVGQAGAGASGYAQISNGSVTNIVITRAGGGYPAETTIQIYPPVYPVLSIDSSQTTMPSAVATPVIANGFIVGANVTARGAAYVAPPSVSFTDVSGRGAAAYAQIANGGITNIVITMAGFGYSSNATINISAPPVLEAVTISASNLMVGQNYELLTATNLADWTPVGDPFSPPQITWTLVTNSWNAVTNTSQVFFRLQMVP